MSLHVSGKLSALGLVIAALITAFSLPERDGLPLAITPSAHVLEIPRVAEPPSLTEHGPIANPSFTVRATGYNSFAGQTDASPHVTATGAVTRTGIIAVSRDLLADDIPYGSLVRIRDLGNFYNGRNAGRFQSLLDSQGLFVVEDTMHARKTNQVDVWFADYASAVNWGVRTVEVTVVRYGRSGPQLDPAAGIEFAATPKLLATR